MSSNHGTMGSTTAALAAMLQQLFAAEALADVRRAVVHGAHVLAPHDSVSIHELVGEGLETTLRQGADLDHDAKSLERHLRRLALTSGRTVSTLDRFDDAETDALAAVYRRRPGLCLVRPVAAYGRPVAVLCLHFLGRTTLLDTEFDALRKFCESAAVALYNARVRAGLHDLAYTDALTGLPNRRRLDDELEKLKGREVSVVLIDFDGLKQVNDALDYDRGDALIALIGSALRKTTRTGELVVRLGGDEFVIVLPEAPAHEARSRAEEIALELAALEVPGDIVPYYRGASVGAATATPREDLHAVLRRATAEMHARKRRRKTDPATSAPFDAAPHRGAPEI